MTSNPETAIVLRVFQQAWALPADGRPAFLMEACRNNAALFDEVQKLFQAMEQTESSFLDTTGTNEGLSATWDAALTEGTVIGPYRILRPIGKGGMGEVYLASRSSDYRAEVAIKVARRESPHALARFHRERQILATLDHPNVCRILDGGSLPPDERPYLVMEFVKGHLLHEHCDRRNHGVRERVELLLELCRTIADCHRRGVLHRDLSPNNVMATEEGTIKVMDFGLAAVIEETADVTQPHDGLSAELGVGVTLPYASPEQIDFDGTQSLDTRSDIYMLGGLMYRLLCGQAPFDGMSRSEQIEAIRFHEPLRPRRIRPALPLDLETVCLKCLEKNPNNRYVAACELGDDLERVLRNEPVKARRASVLERANRWRQRNRILAALLAILAVVTAVGLGSTMAAVRQAWTFQSTSQEVLGKLASALNESYFLNPSAYSFDNDFRDSLSNEMAVYAEQTIREVPERVGSKPLLAAMRAHLAIHAFNHSQPDAGAAHFRESLRLWRSALRDDPTNDTAARSLAITVMFYADSAEKGALSVSELENGKLFSSFSYRDPVDKKVAESIATLWNQRQQAFSKVGVYGSSLDTYSAATLIWSKLYQQAPRNKNYLRGLATAHYEHADTVEKSGGNLGEAAIAYLTARDLLIESRNISPLNESDLELLTNATWGAANIVMRHQDWEKGRALFDEALTLGNQRVERAAKRDEMLNCIAFLTSIQWHTIEEMRTTVPEKERMEIVERFHDYLLDLMDAKNLTELDSARLGACQYILAVSEKQDPAVKGRRLLSARHNLTWGVDYVKGSRDKWLTWRSKVHLELGDPDLASLPKTQKEYYEAAHKDAQAAIDAHPVVKEPLNVIYIVKDLLQKLPSAEASAK